MPVRGIDQIRIFGQPPRSAMGTCNVCQAAADPTQLVDGRCPSCDLGVGHRQLRFALDECGEIAAGATVLGVDLTPREREALLGQAARLFNYESGGAPPEMPAAGSVDLALWHRPRDRADQSRAVAEIARSLKPGGILVGVRTGDETLPPGFIRASMPAIDPVTAEAGLIDVAYKPGGHLIGLSRAARRARRNGAGTLVEDLRNRARRLLRAVVEYARRRR
jgi:SAM-dependent methyltransferase